MNKDREPDHLDIQSYLERLAKGKHISDNQKALLRDGWASGLVREILNKPYTRPIDFFQQVPKDVLSHTTKQKPARVSAETIRLLKIILKQSDLNIYFLKPRNMGEGVRDIHLPAIILNPVKSKRLSTSKLYIDVPCPKHLDLASIKSFNSSLIQKVLCGGYVHEAYHFTPILQTQKLAN